MVSVNNISVEFGGTPLFEQVSFFVGEKERLGLAGKNGAGKTTMLRILCGEIKPSSGDVVVSEEEKTGYLPQEKKVQSRKNVLQETLSAFSNVEELKKKRDVVQQELVVRTDYESKSYLKLFEELNSLNDRLAILDEGQLEGFAVKVLRGLGFTEEELGRPVNTFSPGWQMRIELAKLLLLQPALLLLDEPTNHLDLDSIQWLESYLRGYKGSVILVSHDRRFLDNLTTRTIEINNGKIYDYKVSYLRYLELRDERINQQKAEYNNQQKQIREIEQFIERFRYKATKARQVQSRVKHLEKMDRVAIDDLDNSEIHFRFPPAPRSGKVVVEGHGVFKSYGQKKVLNGIDFQIIKGEKVAFVGRNGEGKTTLSKILSKQLDYNKGEIKFGHNVQIGYYSQDQWEMLDPSKTVFETVDDVAVGEARKRLTSILGAFLFQGDDIDKKVSILSGGEKARLSLAKLLLKPSNLLILDEPTNHLDLLSKDILKTALLEYDGSLILVSHDRDFLSGLTERFYEFRNHQIKEFRGTLQEYLEKKNIEYLQELETNAPKKKEQKTVSESHLDWQVKKEKDRRQRKLKKELENIETLIEKLETELSGVNEKLSKPEEYMEEIKSGKLPKEHGRLEAEIDHHYEKWEEIHRQLEQE